MILLKMPRGRDSAASRFRVFMIWLVVLGGGLAIQKDLLSLISGQNQLIVDDPYIPVVKVFTFPLAKSMGDLDESQFIEQDVDVDEDDESENESEDLVTTNDKVILSNDENDDEKEAELIINQPLSSVNTCMNRYRREWVKGESENVHDIIAERMEELAVYSSCHTSMKYAIYKAPHFSGGARQFRRYFTERKWTPIDVRAMNKSSFDKLPRDTVVLMTPCLYSLPLQDVQRRVKLVSQAPNELSGALKIPFYRAIVKLFTSNQCDYRTFHPESFLLESPDVCRELTDRLTKERDQHSSAVWFFKSRRDSFGDGVKVRSAADALMNLPSCSSINKKRSMFIQRGVSSIMRYEGRMTQGRAYILISSYNPPTVWFFMGYFNVAADVKVDDSPDQPLRSAHITNTRSNQKSARLLFSELFKDKTREEKMILKKNIKEAAFISYLALRSNLGENPGSFSMFGFDFLVQSDLSVKVLETNCNCELFMNENAGPQRLAISTNLVRSMMDIVLASNLNPDSFRDLLLEHINSSMKHGDKDIRGLGESVDLDDDSSESGVRRSWELLYTEAVTPSFSVMHFSDSCQKLALK